jgi:hypothetical protein
LEAALLPRKLKPGPAHSIHHCPRSAIAARRRIASDREANAAVLHHWYWGKRDIDDLDDQERLVAEIVTGIISAKIAA